MERKDYLLREIEKMRSLICAIREKLLGGNGNLAITLETHIENAKAMLLNEVNFDLDKFLTLSSEDSNKYISSFKEVNIENIELLAGYIADIGFNDQCDNPKKYLEKALQLYDFCTLESKTYSFERETNIKAIKNVL